MQAAASAGWVAGWLAGWLTRRGLLPRARRLRQLTGLRPAGRLCCGWWVSGETPRSKGIKAWATRKRKKENPSQTESDIRRRRRTSLTRSHLQRCVETGTIGCACPTCRCGCPGPRAETGAFGGRERSACRWLSPRLAVFFFFSLPKESSGKVNGRKRQQARGRGWRTLEAAATYTDVVVAGPCLLAIGRRRLLPDHFNFSRLRRLGSAGGDARASEQRQGRSAQGGHEGFA